MIAKLTIPALKSLAIDMNLLVPNKARKGDIVSIISEAIDQAHAEAITENRSRTVKTATESAPKSDAERMRNRVQNYMNQNGTDKLTAAQRRRIRKNENRTGVNHLKLSYVFP